MNDEITIDGVVYVRKDTTTRPKEEEFACSVDPKDSLVVSSANEDGVFVQTSGGAAIHIPNANLARLHRALSDLATFLK